MIAGVTNDFLFNNYQFLLVTVWNLITILWNLWDIIYPIHNEDYISWSLALFGIASGFSDMYITILLPMTLADKNRLFAYELTMLGTIIALVNFATFVSTSLLSSFVIYVLLKDVHLGDFWNRCWILTLLVLSTWAFWKQARNQFDNFRWRNHQNSQI